MNKTYNNLIKKTFASVKALALGSFLLAGALQTVAAQNIANPNFEILTTAGTYPTTFAQMSRAAGN